MSRSRSPAQNTVKPALIVIAAVLVFLFLLGLIWRMMTSSIDPPIAYASTIAGLKGDFGEPFGIAVKNGRIYVSDGEKNEIRVIDGDTTRVFASGLNTPSAIAFNAKGDLVVADTGSHTIKSIDEKGAVTVVAGVENKAGLADGDAGSALFHGPIGIAVDNKDRIFVADTYNDRIRVIENGTVQTLADGFDTPTGIAIWNDKLLVADTGNRRMRVVEVDGSVWTLAGDGNEDVKDGLLLSASFYEPTGITINAKNEIFVTDGNAIRKIAGAPIPTVITINDPRRGFKDGAIRRSRFNRPSMIAFTGNDVVVADSDNRVIRKLATAKGVEVSNEQLAALRDKPEEFRSAQPPRWPFDPPTTPRDVAGTFGELRGEIKPGSDEMHFHNGLDIAGAYGETARSIRSEKVLRPIATANFNTLRELIRMPTLGYVHVRLGRDQANKPFDDARFLFRRNDAGKLIDVRVPRGATFNAGDPIGTLNAMNHVHLVAGRSGSEMNAIDALAFPGLADSRTPIIEKVWLTNDRGLPLETKTTAGRIQISGKVRVLARAYDQMEGNSERRRLGLFRAGYQLLNADGAAVGEEHWNIAFARLPDAAAVPLVYAEGSSSGATGETVFDYIVTNEVNETSYREVFLDTTSLSVGNHIIRVLAADYFGNVTDSDILVEVVR